MEREMDGGKIHQRAILRKHHTLYNHGHIGRMQTPLDQTLTGQEKKKNETLDETLNEQEEKKNENLDEEERDYQTLGLSGIPF